MNWLPRRLVPFHFRRYHFVAVLVGVQSHEVHLLPFARFRTVEEGQAWCDVMNEHSASTMTRFELRPR